MAIARVTQGYLELSPEKGESNRRYPEKYYVHLTPGDSTTTAPQIMTASDGLVTIPQQGASHPSDPEATVRRVRPTRIGPELWRVDVEYESPVHGAASQQATNPLLRPPLFSYKTIFEKQVARRLNYLGQVLALNPDPNDDEAPIEALQLLTKIKRLQPFLTSSREEVDPQYEVDSPIGVLVVRRNEANISTGFVDEFVGAINDAPWFGRPKHTWKCTGIDTGEITKENGIEFFRVTYEFQYKKRGWYIDQLDAGFYHLEPGDPLDPEAPDLVQERNTDENGEEMVVQSLLNGEGDVLTIDEAPGAIRAVYLRFQEDTLRNFTAMMGFA